MKNIFILLITLLLSSTGWSKVSLELESAWDAESMFNFFESHNISKNLEGLYLKKFKVCFYEQCADDENKAALVVNNPYKPNLDSDKNSAHYRHYNSYKAAIVFLASRRGSKAASVFLLRSIELNENQLKQIEAGTLNFGAYPNQRIAEVRTLAVRALGLVDQSDSAVVSTLNRIAVEGKNPFGIYDMQNGFRSELAAKKSIALLGLEASKEGN